MVLVNYFSRLLFDYDEGHLPKIDLEKLNQAEKIRVALLCANPIINDTTTVDTIIHSLDKKYALIFANALYTLYGNIALLDYVEHTAIQTVLKREFLKDYRSAKISKLAPSILAQKILKSKQATKYLADAFGFDAATFTEGLIEYTSSYRADFFEKEKPMLDFAEVWTNHEKFFQVYPIKQHCRAMLNHESFRRNGTRVVIMYDKKQSYKRNKTTGEITLTMLPQSNLKFLRFLLEHTSLEEFTAQVHAATSKFLAQTALQKFDQQFLFE